MELKRKSGGLVEGRRRDGDDDGSGGHDEAEGIVGARGQGVSADGRAVPSVVEGRIVERIEEDGLGVVGGGQRITVRHG